MTCVFPLLPPILWLLESSVLLLCVVGALSADSQTHCWALAAVPFALQHPGSRAIQVDDELKVRLLSAGGGHRGGRRNSGRMVAVVSMYRFQDLTKTGRNGAGLPLNISPQSSSSTRLFPLEAYFELPSTRRQGPLLRYSKASHRLLMLQQTRWARIMC